MSVFSVGTVLSRSFSTFFKHLFVFTGLVLIFQVPLFLLSLWMQNAEIPILPFLLTLLTQGAIAYGVYEVNMGKPAQFVESLSKGCERISDMISAALAVGLCYVLIGVVGFIAVMAIGNIAFIFVGLPAVLFMIFLWCKWSVLIPACVVERLGAMDSLNRSSDLTYGCRLKIFALYLMNFTILLIVFFVTAILTSIHPALSVVELIVDAIPMAFLNVMTAVIYYELRSVKEGVSIDSLANVFD